MTFKLPRHPHRLDAKHPRLIEDLLKIAETNQDAVDAIIHMLKDFHQNGHQSRFAHKLQGLPVWELKTRSRGQKRGGARVYFYFLGNNQTAVLVNAEDKEGTEANDHLLNEVAEILLADRNGIPLY